MSYEEIKQQISEFLTSRGFTQEEDVFTRTDKRVAQTVIVNGQQHHEYEEVVIKITCLGEGAIDETPIIGWNITLDGLDTGDMWVQSLEDFNSFIKF